VLQRALTLGTAHRGFPGVNGPGTLRKPDAFAKSWNRMEPTSRRRSQARGTYSGLNVSDVFILWVTVCIAHTEPGSGRNGTPHYLPRKRKAWSRRRLEGCLTFNQDGAGSNPVGTTKRLATQHYPWRYKTGEYRGLAPLTRLSYPRRPKLPDARAGGTGTQRGYGFGSAPDGECGFSPSSRG
jgi:hypothetical protein